MCYENFKLASKRQNKSKKQEVNRYKLDQKVQNLYWISSKRPLKDLNMGLNEEKDVPYL